MIEHVRTYSNEEHNAFRAISRRVWGDPYRPERGAAQFAGGDYWPSELGRLADEMERLIPLYRLAADALRREIAADPRCAEPKPLLPEVRDPAAVAAREHVSTSEETS